MQKLNIFNVLDKYNLSLDEKDLILSIINEIYIHDEFQRRMTDEYPHHDKITLGEHILEVTITAYILYKKHYKNKNVKLDLVLKIAMMHDLYTEPWQNNDDTEAKDRFLNWHGFRHPIEGVINSAIWFPEIFDKKEEKKIIIDGIVHHMFPFPVHRFVNSETNELQLRNYEYLTNIDKDIIEMLISSCNRGKIGELSICQSMYKEGQSVSIADKLVSMRGFKGSNFEAVKALVTGKNKNLHK